MKNAKILASLISLYNRSSGLQSRAFFFVARNSDFERAKAKGNCWHALTATLLSDVSHGSLTFNPDGSFIYTPASSFSGVDSFTYQVSDGLLNSNATTVTLNVSDLTPHVSSDGGTIAMSIDFSAFTPNFNFANSVVTVAVTGAQNVADHLSISQSDHVNTIGNHLYYNGLLVGQFTAQENHLILEFNQSGSVDVLNALAQQIHFTTENLAGIEGIQIHLSDMFGYTINEFQPNPFSTKNPIANVQDSSGVVSKNTNAINAAEKNNIIIQMELIQNNASNTYVQNSIQQTDKPPQAVLSAPQAAIPTDHASATKPKSDVKEVTNKSAHDPHFSEIPGIWNLLKKNSAIRGVDREIDDQNIVNE